MTTIFEENNATSTPGKYILEEEVEGETPPPLDVVVYNGTGHYIDGEIEGKIKKKNLCVKQFLFCFRPLWLGNNFSFLHNHFATIIGVTGGGSRYSISLDQI